MILGAGLGTGLAASGAMGATAAAMTGLGAMATLAQGVSSYQQGEYNQKVMEQQADAKQLANKANESVYKKRITALLGRQRAGFVANGITFEGSPMEMMLDSAYQYEVDKSIRKFNSDTEASYYRNKGEMSMMEGRANLFNSFLSTGVSTFDRMDQYAKA